MGLRSGNDSGQVLAEFGIGATLVTLAIIGGAWIFRTQWERNQCAIWSFESAHLRLTGNWKPPTGLKQKTVQVLETPEGVQAVGRCGPVVETVGLKKLAHIPW